MISSISNKYLSDNLIKANQKISINTVFSDADKNFKSIYSNKSVQIAFKSRALITQNNYAMLRHVIENIDADIRAYGSDIPELVRNKNIFIKGNPFLSKKLNHIAKAFSELINAATNKDGHGNSVLDHSLRVAKLLIEDEDYKTLNRKEKFIAKMAAIFHDIGKQAEGQSDHPLKSAEIFLKNGSRIDLPLTDLFLIHNQIQNHHWAGDLKQGKRTMEEVAQTFTTSDSLKMAVLIARADITAGGIQKHIEELIEMQNTTIRTLLRMQQHKLQIPRFQQCKKAAAG